MANEDMMEMDEMAEDAGAQASGGGGGGNPLKRYLPYIGVLLVVQVVLAYFIMQWFFSPDASSEHASAQVEASAPNLPAAGAASGAYQPPPVAVTTIFDQIDVIVVNPAGTQGLRFLSAQISLGLSDAKVEAHILTNNLTHRIKDTLVRIMSSKTISDLDPSNHDVIKDEIRMRLNTFLGANAVVEVYFQTFVLQ